MKHFHLGIKKKRNEKNCEFFRTDRWEVHGDEAERQTAASGLAGASARMSGTQFDEMSDSRNRRRRELSHQHHHNAAASTYRN